MMVLQRFSSMVVAEDLAKKLSQLGSFYASDTLVFLTCEYKLGVSSLVTPGIQSIMHGHNLYSIPRLKTCQLPYGREPNRSPELTDLGRREEGGCRSIF